MDRKINPIIIPSIASSYPDQELELFSFFLSSSSFFLNNKRAVDVSVNKTIKYECVNKRKRSSTDFSITEMFPVPALTAKEQPLVSERQKYKSF